MSGAADEKKKATPVGVANVERRTWNEQEYEEKAAQRDEEDALAAEESKADARKRKRIERDPLHQGLIVERAKLRAREQAVDLTSRLGRAQTVSAAAPKSAQGGWHCSVCDCVLKDSKTWLDHINGKYHNAALGMGMRVEKSSRDEVKEKLEALAREREEKKRERRAALLGAGASAAAGGGGEGGGREEDGRSAGPSSKAADKVAFDPEDAFARRVAEREAAEAAEREAKRAALAAAKKKNSSKKEEAEEEEGDEEDGDAAAMAAAMGFKSFG